MTEEFIPYGSQWLDEQDLEAVVETLKSDYLTTGPKINEFEEKFADYVDAEYAVAIANGTAALHAATYAAGIGEGDEVITTPITFAASANSILYHNATPVFADVDPDTYNIDPESIEEKITDKTKAIIPVHYTGQPCEMDEIMEIADKYNLTVIADGAHAVGAEYKGQKVGSVADMTTFSFHPVKHITTGEGGMITTDSKDLYDILIKFRTHGITKESSEYINESHGPWYHEQQKLGYNYRITDIQCALGISQLEKIDKFLTRRREIVEEYNKAFSDFEGIIIPEQLRNTNSAWHLYVIQLDLEKLSADRKEIFKDLRNKNLGVNVHYIPVYYHPYYQELGYEKGICPNAENLYERIITIPLYPKMSDQQVEEVINRAKEVIRKYQK
ncbi:UDP-4-amino-4,6-dideoxy-N-acetyl-beta-L-altrosamine transaminase [Halanaerobium kushneri]|jgi:UDP-4-amino-4,6-dideoxy-N-acetyl-beta-L-altrosamine transaminase|uniref:UDP-4-amino-4,6-dideoxy-N-acetyl-beta-L-altrosamine transaminase n=1 Tax=Halanaerobium kushneri TaxID=56779 RepID=A0A1N6RN80_9FIRM|nr:UDP-4-amino-4,6-dideoxy-N-acetyl-beta-L-altrosamine transaminase [Halanaerobium kushneri]SIQ30261.1 UDP-4-amino-4,6-dideoxy-N-acetyl-beta-L-altrosamine transaminase [Halanaerobium kushneri]